MDAIGKQESLESGPENAARYINEREQGLLPTLSASAWLSEKSRCGRKVSKAWKEGIETYRERA